MGIVDVNDITDLVISNLGKSHDITDRQRDIMTSLVKHLHGFCKDVNLQHGEFRKGCEFLTRAGQNSDETHQEVTLLGDILGIEVLLNQMTNPIVCYESQSSVLGSNYREHPPFLPNGASIILKHFDNEETVYFEGVVRNSVGVAIPGAIIDVWEDAPNGVYENLDTDQPEYNLRGRFETDENGRYAFIGVRPVPYSVSENGAAHELIRFMGHHSNRPAHVHFVISKEGYDPLVTQIYDANSPWLENDCVFAVKDNLIADFKLAPEKYGTDLYVKFDFRIGINRPDFVAPS